MIRILTLFRRKCRKCPHFDSKYGCVARRCSCTKTKTGSQSSSGEGLRNAPGNTVRLGATTYVWLVDVRCYLYQGRVSI